MNLKEYYEKYVEIIASNNKTFKGFVDEYYYPEDNESGCEGICLYTNDKKYIGFEEKDIKTIKILQDEASNE